VPAVSIQTDAFKTAVEMDVLSHGMPGLRFVYVPQPVMGKSPAELRAYIDGNDPTTGKPVMEEVLDGLLRPLSAAEAQGGSYDRTTPRLVEPDTEENLRALFMANHWTDYLPIVLPTVERVEEMLAHTSHKPDEVVGRLRPTSTRESWQFTVEKVAVNAVMAGCKPEYFPVVLALAASGVSARGSTTSSMAAMTVVNGPIRHELKMNWGTGAMGPYNEANATIGRAYGLLSTNLQGGSTPGETYLGSQGNNYAYNSICFAENEERSPWAPLHVQKGYRREDSVVSVFTGCRCTAYCLGLRETFWKEHVQYLLRGMDPHTSPCLVLDPITARQFVDRGGFVTAEQCMDWLYEAATMPAAHYWDYQLIQNYVLPRALNGVEPYATKLMADPDELIHMFRRDEFNIVVVGGETNGYWRIMGAGYGKSVRVDDWR